MLEKLFDKLFNIFTLVLEFIEPKNWSKKYRRIFVITLPLSLPVLLMLFTGVYIVGFICLGMLALIYGGYISFFSGYTTIKNFWNDPEEEKEYANYEI